MTGASFGPRERETATRAAVESAPPEQATSSGIASGGAFGACGGASARSARATSRSKAPVARLDGNGPLFIAGCSSLAARGWLLVAQRVTDGTG